MLSWPPPVMFFVRWSLITSVLAGWPFTKSFRPSARLLPSEVTTTCVHAFVGTRAVARMEMALPGQKWMSDHLSLPSSISSS